mmetsp:Transcript_133868/g.373266  ORF Transcript_133868/g.373266 Transcript_133868/m.373266 type:complete len:256 (+) Transcript_133868:1-768(+)
MSAAEAVSRERQAHKAAARRLQEEREAMAAEDVLAHGARREERNQQCSRRELEREFHARKANHRRRADEEARRLAAEEERAERARRAREKEAAARLREQRESAQRAAEEQRQAEAAIAARLAAESAASERKRERAEARRREAILAEEQEAFEVLYRRNRGLAAAARRGEEASGHRQTQASSPSGVTSASQGQPRSEEREVAATQATGPAAAGPLAGTGRELLELAQTLSAAFGPCGRGDGLGAVMDEGATFFTDA